MKKTYLKTILILMFSCFQTTILLAENEDRNLPSQNSKIEAEDCRLLLSTRVAEIRSMDKSELNSLEKKELKKELKAIQNDIKASQKAERTNGNGGVYISLTGLLIVIILLIILL